MEILFVAVLLLLSGSGASLAELRERRSDDAGPLEVVVQQLSQQVTSLTAQLTQLTDKFNNEIAALKAKTNSLDTTVAFHAWGSTNPILVISQGTLILDHATTNIGNAYDASTGVFSAPVAGLYVFHAAIMKYNIPASVAYAGIYVDGHLLSLAMSDSRRASNYAESPLTVVTHLNAGSKVLLKNIDSASADYYSSRGEPYTTFSGFLVKAD